MIYSVGAAGKETEVWRGPGRLQEEEAAVVVVEEVRPVFCGKASVRSFLSWTPTPRRSRCGTVIGRTGRKTRISSASTNRRDARAVALLPPLCEKPS